MGWERGSGWLTGSCGVGGLTPPETGTGSRCSPEPYPAGGGPPAGARGLCRPPRLAAACGQSDQSKSGERSEPERSPRWVVNWMGRLNVMSLCQILNPAFEHGTGIEDRPAELDATRGSNAVELSA